MRSEGVRGTDQPKVTPEAPRPDADPAVQGLHRRGHGRQDKTRTDERETGRVDANRQLPLIKRERRGPEGDGGIEAVSRDEHGLAGIGGGHSRRTDGRAGGGGVQGHGVVGLESEGQARTEESGRQGARHLTGDSFAVDVRLEPAQTQVEHCTRVVGRRWRCQGQWAQIVRGRVLARGHARDRTEHHGGALKRRDGSRWGQRRRRRRPWPREMPGDGQDRERQQVARIAPGVEGQAHDGGQGLEAGGGGRKQVDGGKHAGHGAEAQQARAPGARPQDGDEQDGRHDEPGQVAELAGHQSRQDARPLEHVVVDQKQAQGRPPERVRQGRPDCVSLGQGPKPRKGRCFERVGHDGRG